MAFSECLNFTTNWFILKTNQTGSSKRMLEPWINEFEIELEHICDLIGILRYSRKSCKERLCKRNKKLSEIKVSFCQFLSYLQRDEHFNFLDLNIWILMTENCLEIEDLLKFETLEACKVKKIWLARAAFKIIEVQIFKLRKVKWSSVWRYEKNIYTIVTKTYLYSSN